MREITLIGGGIGGLALGCALRKKGVSTTIREAEHYPRHRVCGEFLAGIRPRTLAALGLEDLLEGATMHQEVAWYQEARKPLHYRLPYPAAGLSRWTLDARLASRFEACGGHLSTGDRVRERPTEREAGTVWTTGKTSGKSTWLGLKVHLIGEAALPGSPKLEMHLGDDAYVGISSVEAGRKNVCGLFRRRPGLSGPKMKLLPEYCRAAGLSSLADRLETASPDEPSFCAVSGFTFGMQPRKATDPERLCVGDQFGMIPPFTGNGMTMALEGAAVAFPTLMGYAREECSWEATVARVHYDLRRAFRRRLLWANFVQNLLQRRGTKVSLLWLAERGCLPFSLLYRLLH